MESTRLDSDQVNLHMDYIEGWKHQIVPVPEPTEDKGMESLFKMFPFSNYKEVREFVNKVADIAESLAHYPSITFTGNYCTLLLWTENLKGLTEKDFGLAKEIDKLGVPFTKF